ncbi:acyltransferase [Pararhizobium sp. BT-229]|uniref:acyltransferase family protein n=1 Tax=Pararhizobium sp. BT-229 TaxID=2986923 RepID=UPI0021F764E3|nr:acyltransferase [Pararhizobium sp. BT-229]MCV9963897.1 acyltransferase [Pararhizobium sp. BT-229]
MKRSSEIQGLRGICVAVVMLFHFAIPFRESLLSGGWHREALYRLANIGWIGVDFFFAISGFVVTLVLLKRDQNYVGFMRRRAGRLLPSYFALLVLSGLLTLAAPAIGLPLRSGFAENQLWAWTLTANIATSMHGGLLEGGNITLFHLWSLCVEMQFYLVWPFLVWNLDGRRLVLAMVGVAIAAFTLRSAATYAGVYYNAVYSLTPFRLDGFAMGGLAATLAVSGRKVPAAPWLAGLLLVPSILWFLADIGWHKADGFVQAVGYTVMGAGAAALVLSAYQETLWTPFRRLLAGGQLVHVGDRSYSLYLWHLPFMGTVNLGITTALPDLGPSTVWFVILVNSIVALGLAEFGYRLLERARFGRTSSTSGSRTR